MKIDKSSIYTLHIPTEFFKVKRSNQVQYTLFLAFGLGEGMRDRKENEKTKKNVAQTIRDNPGTL